MRVTSVNRQGEQLNPRNGANQIFIIPKLRGTLTRPKYATQQYQDRSLNTRQRNVFISQGSVGLYSRTGRTN